MVLAGSLSGVREGAKSALSEAISSIYEEHFDFVWRSARRLGVAEAAVDDAVHDVFLIVHQKLSEFEARSSLRTWIFGIVTFVARDHTRQKRELAGIDIDSVPDANPDPFEARAKHEQVELLHRLLAQLDFDRRAVFILAELEEMSAPEIVEALGIKLNTVYSRLRSARLDYERVALEVAQSDEAVRTLALGERHVHEDDIAYATRVDAFDFAMELRRDASGSRLAAIGVGR